MQSTRLSALILLLGAFIGSAHAASVEENLARIELPEGFRISLYAEVPNAREMAVVAPLGVVFVSDENESVYALRPGPNGRARVEKVLSGLDAPSGLAFRDGWLYVGEHTRVLRYKAEDVLSGAKPEPKVIMSGFPNSSHHGTRILTTGSDGKVYVTVGVPCNVCQPKNFEGMILRSDPDGGNRESFASGTRNAVGLAFEPSTNVLYFTDNGVDQMGDDSPPDELNRAPKPGLFFGFPYYGGGRDRPRAWANKPVPHPVTFPALEFEAHVAVLGMTFYRGGNFPPDYQGDAFVAQHGSWNRSVPIGYRVMRVRFENGMPVKAEPFAQGWLTEGQDVLGRPADVKEAQDGSLLVSDDHNGAIYRITYAP